MCRWRHLRAAVELNVKTLVDKSYTILRSDSTLKNFARRNTLPLVMILMKRQPCCLLAGSSYLSLLVPYPACS